MDLRTFAARSSLFLSLGIASAAIALSGTASRADELLRIGVNEATIAWPPPSDPLIDAYIVYVSRNGGPEQIQEVVDQPMATLEGDFGEQVVARVRAVGRTSAGGAIVASAPSPPSPTIHFSAPPVFWNAQGLLALHCAVCAELQLRPVSNRVAPTHSPSLPEPWRLVDVGAVAPNGLDAIWQNEDTGVLLVIPFGADISGTIGGAGSSNMDRFRALALAELDGDDTRELLVRDLPTGAIQIWEYRFANLVPIGGAFAPATWRLASSADFDGDGISDLWWQTDLPGRVEVWRANASEVTGLHLRVDTGADGDIVAVADFDGDGFPEPLWRTATGALTISYLSPGAEGSFGKLERSQTLAGLPGDDQLVVRGVTALSPTPGQEILVQNTETYGVSAIFPEVVNAPGRTPLFDLNAPFELVYVR